MLWRRWVLSVSFSVPKYLLVSLISAKVHEFGESVSLVSVGSSATPLPNVKYWLSFVGVGGVSCVSSSIKLSFKKFKFNYFNKKKLIG